VTTPEKPWCRFDPTSARLTITIYVQPGARSSEICGLHGSALKIKIAAPAVDNKANAAFIEFLHRFLGLPSSLIRVRHGARGRHKLVEVVPADAAMYARIKSAARG